MMIRRTDQIADPAATYTLQGATMLDVWIERELKRSYDAVLAEPVPADMLRLLGQLPPEG